METNKGARVRFVIHLIQRKLKETCFNKLLIEIMKIEFIKDLNLKLRSTNLP